MVAVGALAACNKERGQLRVGLGCSAAHKSSNRAKSIEKSLYNDIATACRVVCSFVCTAGSGQCSTWPPTGELRDLL